jgi:sulfonate transport system substrate-binding protein
VLCRNLARLLVVLAVALLHATPGRTETVVNFVHQPGLSLMPILIMESEGLIEKRAKSLGITDLKVNWITFANAGSMSDALLSGSANFVSSGVPTLVQLWNKTPGDNRVMGVSPTGRLPLLFNIRREGVRSLADLTPNDRIAVPGAKLSVAALMLQMAVAKQFGPDNYAKLDSQTVTFADSDAVAQLVTGAGDVTAHFAPPPYGFLEAQNPKVRTVFSSYDITGPVTVGIILTTSRFYKAHPKVVDAVRDALSDAVTLIKSDPDAAIAKYLAVSGEKLAPEQVKKIIKDIDFNTRPRGVMMMADFMKKVGVIARKPESLSDIFLPGAMMEEEN